MNLDTLTDALRALRLKDETAVIVSIGSVTEPGCGPVGAISVTATKRGHTATSEALRLEDALLMVRARLDEMIELVAKKAAANKETKA